MSLSSYNNGSNIVLKCDVCGRPTNSLRRVSGVWVNPKTKRKITNRPGWLCLACFEKLRRGDAK